MIRIAIRVEAFEAVAAALPLGSVVDNVTTHVVSFLRRPLLTSARVALP